MNYATEMRAMLDEQHALDGDTAFLRRELKRQTAAVITADVSAEIEQWKATNPAFNHAGKAQHDRAQHEREAAERSTRTAAAAVQRHAVEGRTRALRERVAAFVESIQADAEITLPHALDRLDPVGMLQFNILRELRRGRLERAEPAELLASYRAALQTGDAAALIDVQIIEEIAATKTAGDMAQRPAARELRETVAGIREARIPVDVIAIGASLDAAATATAHADLVVHAVDPARDPSAKAAHEIEMAVDEAEQVAGA